MKALRVLVADDERLMREQLCARLLEIDPSLDIVAQARNGQEALDMTQDHHPDVVFLDIRMPVMTGVEVAQHIAQLPTYEEAGGDGLWPGCEVVFVTAYDEYAVAAFEQGVVDYVLKPAERARLGVALERVKARIQQRQEQRQEQRHDGQGGDGQDQGQTQTQTQTNNASQAEQDAALVDPLPLHTPHMHGVLQRLSMALDAKSAAPLRWIQASVGQSIQLIPVEDVLFFVSDEKYTRVQTATTEALIRKPIKELVGELDMNLFWQIHRSTVVNARAIAGVSRDHRGRQLVSIRGLTEKLEVSRSYAGLFKGM